MKKLLLLLLVVFLASFSSQAKEIVARVVFENRTDEQLTSGEFFIIELNKTIQINSEEDFNITLPEKGKYRFSFISTKFDVYTYYPAKISQKNNQITIRLQEKGKAFQYSKEKNSYSFSMKNVKAKSDQPYFIFNGINNTPIDFENFKEKYGVGMRTENCVVDPFTLKETIQHNKAIVKYLNEKFGDQWLEDLPAKPFGIK